MSITNRVSRSRIAPKEVLTPLDRVRLAIVGDAVHILPLCTESMKKTFRVESVEDIEYLIENSVFSLTQLNAPGDVAGFMALREYPQIPSIDPGAWEEYVWNKYKSIELTARSTLWIHLMCWKRCYSREVLESLLKSVYMTDAYIHHICFIKTLLNYPQLVPGTSRAEACFRRVQATERGMPGESLPALLISDRIAICPRLRVRRAVEEDNDDLVPIIERHSQRLRELYGDFYISELIARHPESDRVILVCEHKEVAVGVMILNTQINFQSLEECFELSPYGGLRNLDQAPHKHKLSDDTYSYVSDHLGSTYNSSHNQDSMSVGSHSTDSRNNPQGGPLGDMAQKEQTAEEKERMERDRVNERILYGVQDGKLLGNVSVLQYFDRFAEEDEDLEFDIVNIDPELLRVPILNTLSDPISKNLISGRTKEYVDKDEERIILPPKEIKTESAPSTAKKPPEYFTRYSGTPNAFLLEVCGMNQDYDERNAFDMLEAAFEIFPDRDYCVISLPSNHPPFPLLEHFTLVAPHSTRMRFINESLYVAHINSVRGDVSMRPGEMADMDKLNDIFEHTAKHDTLITLFEQALQSRVLNTFMLLSQKQPIGCIILGPLADGVNIRTQYDLNPEPRWALADGAIIAGVMSPIMDPHARWFLRDLMRQTRYCTLFWVCQPFAKGELVKSFK